MLVFRMLCRITQSSDAHGNESVSVMDHEQTMGVNSRVLDQKQQNIVGRISLFWSVELQGHPEQLNGGDHNWLIQTPVSTVQWGMFWCSLTPPTCSPGPTNTLSLYSDLRESSFHDAYMRTFARRWDHTRRWAPCRRHRQLTTARPSRDCHNRDRSPCCRHIFFPIADSCDREQNPVGPGQATLLHTNKAETHPMYM